ncbi:MAG: isoleucine--tRNA ligase [Halobacteriaceae archaeon]
MDPDADGPLTRDGLGDVADQYDPHAVEDRVREHWDAVDAYEQTVDHHRGDDPFFFVDGPPYTSGAAHMGTTWNKTLKDAVIRHLRMTGHDVTDRPGYDMHGLPIETRVEERLGFENKKDIEAFGMEAFIEECKAYAEDQLEGLQSDFQSFGVWMDWEHPYRTIDPEYMEAAWWAFAQAADRGLVERGQRSISQCPRCETAIANNEVEYHEVEDPSIYVTFPLTDREGALVAWTTTPWTVPANTFVAVATDLTYQAVRAERDGESRVLWIAESCVEDVLSAARFEDYEVLESVDGEEMVGWTYAYPLADAVPDHPDGEGVFQVYTADYVEADRTGLVHSAPGHGEEDFRRGRELDLPTFCPVGSDGVFTEAAGAYAGQFVRDANDDIIDDLDAAGHLLAADTYTHSYGQCWRCDTDIVQLVTDQWFITVTDIKDELLDNIEDSEWHPPGARDERFRNFVEESPDWNVSRQRYWGIPLPIWTPSDWGGAFEDVIVVGTREELADRVDQDIDPDSVDLHRPTVDDLTITEDDTTYTRVPDVFDVWLDSSVASLGTLDYPSETDAFEALWPADLIVEAHDQTRGWFWSQLGMGTAALGEIPYKEVLMHGHALMPDGRAMSKSRGITVEPGDVLDEHGADPMRAFLLSVDPQGDDMRFSWEETAEMERRLNILWNVFRFPLPYMALDGYDPADPDPTADDVALETVDAWVLSRLQTVKTEMGAAWADLHPDRALDTLLAFVVEDVSRYYVQVVRERMWDPADSPQKRGAYATLATVLHDVVALLSPYTPYLAEAIYQHLTGDAGHPTVHMCAWPTAEEDLQAPELEATIDVVRDVEEAGADARQRVGRKRRWPVPRVIVDTDDDAVVAAVRQHRDLLADRLNARSIDLVDDWDELAYTVEADMSELGPAFGGDAARIQDTLEAVELSTPDLEALRTTVADDLPDPDAVTASMVEFVEVLPDPVAKSGFDGGTVYVDATITEDIESEGYTREVVRRVQQMRKELDLDVEQGIRLDVMVFDDRVAELISRHEDLLTTETRAVELGEIEAHDALTEDWEIEDVDVRITVEPLERAVA